MNNPSSGPANWFYVRDGLRRGPFDRAEMVRELLSLEAPEGTLVWRTGLAAWTKAGILDELKRELPPPLPGDVSPPSGESPLPLPELPGDSEERDAAAAGSTAPQAEGGSAVDGAVVTGTDEEGPPGESAAQRRRRRRRRKARTGGLPAYVLPLVLLFLAVVLGLWFLLRRMNEVPPGRIIQQGDIGTPGGLNAPPWSSARVGHALPRS